jgi:hypothetical protein
MDNSIIKQNGVFFQAKNKKLYQITNKKIYQNTNKKPKIQKQIENSQTFNKKPLISHKN